MTSRDQQIVTYVTDAEYQQLKDWSNDTGKSMSHLLREAVLEYTDHDRARRIEEKVDRLLESVDGSSDGAHAHTRTGCNSVPEKTRAVADHIYQSYDVPIQMDDVELAIENIADVGDERVVEKYKSQLKKRDLLFEHPLQPVWTDDKREWVTWVENATVNTDPHEVTDEYRLRSSEYIKIADKVSQ